MEGRQQPRVEELLNKITFLTKALEYYADQTTYASKNGIAPIDIDRGHQARFALEQIEDIKKYNEKLITDYNDAMNKIKDQMDEPVIDRETMNKIAITIDKHKKKYGI